MATKELYEYTLKDGRKVQFEELTVGEVDRLYALSGLEQGETGASAGYKFGTTGMQLAMRTIDGAPVTFDEARRNWGNWFKGGDAMRLAALFHKVHGGDTGNDLAVVTVASG